MKYFPAVTGKILLAGIFATGCRYVAVSADSSAIQDPVVAPAGTVLRVRLNQALDAGRSRPGDRFAGVLASPVIVGSTEILPKGAMVYGHVVRTQASSSPREERAWLYLTLDTCETKGKTINLLTSPVTRSREPDIVGFTLLGPISG
jgi:hypothetical protein